MTSLSFDKLFYPQSVAVIGASRDPNTVGNDILKNLINYGYKDKIFPVNPKADLILNTKCYHSILEIPDPIDLAIIVVPSTIVPTVLKEATDKKVKAVIIISSGFKEIGEGGLLREDLIKQICLENNMTLIGPNCLGIINTDNNLNASFSSIMPLSGNVGFISQSGALITPIIDLATKLKIGFSKILSIGNKACIKETDIIEYLFNDKQTKIILIYAEQLNNAEKIINTVKKLSKITAKPVIILKSGKTTAGAKASSSHTGSLAGEDTAYEALFKQAGIIRVSNLSEMYSLTSVFINNPVPKGSKVAIITNAGGPGILATDEAVSNGLELASLDKNPVDIIGDAKSDRYEIALNNTLSNNEVDSLLVIVTPQSMTDLENIAKVIIKAKKNYPKPILACFMGADLAEKSRELALNNKISFFEYPEIAMKSLAMFTNYYSWVNSLRDEVIQTFNDVNKEEVRKIVVVVKNDKREFIDEEKSIKILKAYHFPILLRHKATSIDEAQQIANKINKPLAMKIISPDIEHESDVNGVLLNVQSEDAGDKYKLLVANVTKIMPQANLEGVSITEMIEKDGEEMIIGFKTEPDLGKLIMFGLGGVNVEVLNDVAFRFAPLSTDDIDKLIIETRAYKIIKGFRRQPPLDIEAVKECLARLSQLAMEFPEFKELDINPLFILPKGKGVRVLDARIVL